MFSSDDGMEVDRLDHNGGPHLIDGRIEQQDHQIQSHDRQQECQRRAEDWVVGRVHGREDDESVEGEADEEIRSRFV